MRRTVCKPLARLWRPAALLACAAIVNTQATAAAAIAAAAGAAGAAACQQQLPQRQQPQLAHLGLTFQCQLLGGFSYVRPPLPFASHARRPIPLCRGLVGRALWGPREQRAEGPPVQGSEELRRVQGGARKGPLASKQPAGPWENVELYPLARDLGVPRGPLETGAEAWEVSSGSKKDKGPHGDPAVARLPKEVFRPKQSLGQNFLADSNICSRIVKAFKKAVAAAQQRERQQQQQQHQEGAAGAGSRVVEVGPGTGALTRLLHSLYPDMIAVEIDPRAVSHLAQRLPGLRVLHEDVLQVNWPYLAQRMQRLRVVGNLPFYLTSQVSAT
ncbi:hypothetical protein Esti_003854 [Eimeria stiedai]